MGIKEILGRVFHKDEQFKQMEKEIRMQKMLEQRQKTPEERELEAFLEKKRQEEIKATVKQIRLHNKHEVLGGGFGTAKNIFANNPKLFAMNSSLFDGGNSFFN